MHIRYLFGKVNINFMYSRTTNTQTFINIYFTELFSVMGANAITTQCSWQCCFNVAKAWTVNRCDFCKSWKQRTGANIGWHK